MTQKPEIGLDLMTRALLFIVTLLIFWITLEPLKDLSDGALLEPTESSDMFKQVLFLLLFVLSVAKLAAMGWRRILPLAHPAYGVVIAWFFLSSAFAVNPGISVRRLVLSIIVMAIIGVLLLLPRNQRQFEYWLGGCALTVVVLCYLAVIFFPYLAIHQVDSATETNLAGSWRGIYAHKSLAGPMIVMFFIIGIFLFSRKYFIIGIPVIVLSAFFLAFTGAKQPQALMVMVFLWSWVASRVKSTAGLLAICLVPLSIYQVLTVGSAVIPSVAAFNQSVMSDPTFTNRTGIWSFAIKNFLERPLFGFGFFGFWNTEFVRYTVDAAQDPWAAEASHSHNSYLDLALTTGWPGLLFSCWVLLILPIMDFARARRIPENRELAMLFLRIWLFVVFLASLETQFFRRDDAIWITFLIAIFGLRFLASYRLEK